MSVPRVHIAPAVSDEMTAAVESGGGKIVDDPAEADAIVWTLPFMADDLKALLDKSPARWIQLPFAGIESFFSAGAIDPGRTWTCTKGIYGHACAEHALALMLAAARCIPDHVRRDTWREGGFGSPERRLAGKTALVFGAGGIGQELVAMLQPLRMRIVAVNRSGADVPGADVTAAVTALGDHIGEADFVVISAASTPQTRGLFDAPLLARMKPDAWLVNVARGDLVVTDDLVAALQAGSIGGAALDVTEPEPLPDGHPLWGLDNVLITPHVANTWDMAVPELLAMVERNVAAFGSEKPLEGLVDPAAGY